MDGEVLAAQLSELGRQLDSKTAEVGTLDLIATGKAISANEVREKYEDALATAFLASTGTVEVRKAQARLDCTAARWEAQQAAADWERGKSELRTAQAMVRALERRIDIGRSLLSREKTLAAIV